MKVLNAFSVNMVSIGTSQVSFEDVSLEQALGLLTAETVESCVGHPDTANMFENILDVQLPCNRVTVLLEKGETALLGQYSGPRLPEGATVLPPGASIRWVKVTVV